MSGIIERGLAIYRAIKASRTAEDIHDFLGIVEIDPFPGMGVLVLPNHVTAIIEVGGTSYAYANPETSEAIISRWGSAINNARISLQFFLVVRPIVWDLPNGVLDHLHDQVEWSDPSPWQRRRLERWVTAIRAKELDSLFPVPIADIGQYIAVRYPLGDLEVAGTVAEGVYLPPRRSWRFWEKLPSALGTSRTEQLARWRARRDRAIIELGRVVERMMNDIDAVPGPVGSIAKRPLDGTEVVQLIHYLWRHERAFDGPEWLADGEAIDTIRRGEAASFLGEQR